MTDFWGRYPALLYGIFFAIGCHAALSGHPACAIPLLFLLFPFSTSWKRFSLALLLGIASFIYTKACILLPPEESAVFGKAVMVIEEITPRMRFGVSFWKYRARLLHFIDPQGRVVAKNIPCSVRWEGKPHATTYRYEIEGLLRRQGFSCTLQPRTDWHALDSTFSLANWRLRAKIGAKRLLCRFLPPGEARDFLMGILIGEGSDGLNKQLRLFGLQHIIVISGFHFSLIIALCSLFLRGLIQGRLLVCALMLLATSYLVFIGFSPSVLRAWIAVMIALSAQLLHKQSSGLNALGCALLGVLLFDPCMVLSVGFHLSFLATLAILLLYPLFQRLLCLSLPKRPVEDVLQWRWYDQVGYLLLSFFRTSLALGAAVTVLTAPVCLLYFNSFPLLGLLYNLFFPFFVSLVLACSCLALIVSFTPLGGALFACAAHCTDWLLAPVTHAPFLQGIWTVHVDSIPEWAIVLYLSVVIVSSMRAQSI